MATYLQVPGLLSRPAPIADDVGTLISVRNQVSLTSAQVTALIANDVIEVGILPADHVLVRVEIDTDALGTTLATNVGLTADILGTVSAASTIAANSGFSAAAQSLAVVGLFTLAGVNIPRIPVNKLIDRSIILKISAAATAAQLAGIIGVTLTYRTSRYQG